MPNFSKATFNGEVCFYDNTFGEEGAHFVRTEFIHNIKITLQNNASQALITFETCTFSKPIELDAQCSTILTVKDCIIRDLCVLKGEIAKLSLDETKNLGTLFIDWDIAKTIDQNSDTPKSKAKQMCMLKKNYNTLDDYDNEDKAYVAYRRCRRNDRPYVFFDWLLDFIGRYGTHPGRVIICMLFAWLFFGVIFAISIFCGGIYLGTEEELKLANYGFFDKCGIGFYFSAITLLTIGYGDVHPVGWFTQTVAPIAGFVGLFLMSYFTVAVVRKTLR